MKDEELKMKAAIKREKSQTRLSNSEREHPRDEVSIMNNENYYLAL
jgi:hypothetical protein